MKAFIGRFMCDFDNRFLMPTSPLSNCEEFGVVQFDST
jgi:hypothetical protein